MQCWNIALVDEVLCSLTLLSKHLLAVLISTGPLITTSWCSCIGILSLGCINIVLSVLHPLKIIWNSVSLNILSIHCSVLGCKGL